MNLLLEKPPLQKISRGHFESSARRPTLETMFGPRSVAVIGASEKAGSVGRAVLENLLSFHGDVFPVNPNHPKILGQTTFPGISDISEHVDLAVIATPAATVPDIVGECAAHGVSGAVIISAGFKECGPAGAELEKKVLQRRGQMRIIGPNCVGIMLPHIGLNATFAKSLALPGSIGFISQSGALCTSILDWSRSIQLGFSAFVSIGSMADVNWGDLIYQLGDDPHTRSILLYMESIGAAPARFLSAAREVALTKPIIVIKVGHTAAAAKAAASHTGALTGSDDVLDAAFRRVGVLRVDTIEELFGLAELLGKQPRPAGPRLAIVTNGGGPGVLATDALIECGGKLAELSPQSFDQLNNLLPPHWSRGNPIDILGDADAQRYEKAIDIVVHDENNDGVLTILAPQAMTEPSATAEKLRAFAKLRGKPIFASWIGGDRVRPGVEILDHAGIPTFEYPDAAARAFCAMWRYSQNLNALYETPALVATAKIKTDHATRIIERARKAKRTLLNEAESKQILAAYGIPVVETKIARSEKKAVDLAEKIGGKVVLKVFSKTITHKSDVGGVKLSLRGATAVRQAYRAIEKSVRATGDKGFLGVTVESMVETEGVELILGSSIDAQFGPVLLFGAGGHFVEVFKDRALGLPPLNRTLARRLMERTQIYSALRGFRGRAAIDLNALEDILVRFSRLIVEQRRVKEIDINPLLASATKIVALDARILLHDPKIKDLDLPRSTIRPYPVEHIVTRSIKGATVTIRPIRPEDEPLMVDFHRTLSDRSVHFRYFATLSLQDRITHERLRRVCFIDYDREIALVADRRKSDGSREILGIGRLVKEHGANEAEFSILISDPWQGKGLGTELLRLLVRIGRKEGLRRIVGHIVAENTMMKNVCEEVGFDLCLNEAGDEWVAEIDLARDNRR